MIKGKYYITVVRPAKMYGSECWALSKKEEIMINVAKMIILK